MKNQVLTTIIKDVKKNTQKVDLGAEARKRKKELIEEQRKLYNYDAIRWDVYREMRIKE